MNRLNPLRTIPIILCLTLLPSLLIAETVYPRIGVLSPDDDTYRQAVHDIDLYYRAEITGDISPPLTLYSYTTRQNDTLFSVAARFNLPYESIALLNGIRGPEYVHPEMELVVPNQPGIFIPLDPENDLERLVFSWRSPSLHEGAEIQVRTSTGRREFSYLAGERFHPVERSFFLNVLFRFPLSSGILTSGYGSREHPFTHQEHFHHGVDIAAPAGTEVFAAATGEVVARGVDPTLGNYVVLSHEGNFTTIYGHLNKTFVFSGHKVRSGAIIGTVGSTGLSTGPHLHFEIRNSGESWDPSEMLSIEEP